MSNYSYLCSTDVESTYPSFVDKKYKSEEQTIACDVECIPLVWMALFRPQDIVKKTFNAQGQDVRTEAPLVERSKALTQLEEALPYLNSIFAKEGPLDEYFALFKKAVDAVPAKYITVEMQEIACLYPSEQEFYDKFRKVLSNIANKSTTGAKELFIEIACIHPDRKFPPARFILDGTDGEDDDFWNHCRILGAGADNAGIGRQVPWESE